MSAAAFDVVVIGSGPAGQKAAIQAAKAGQRVLVLEKEIGVGGACVHRGTIPSKTLRETAVYLSGLVRRSANAFEVRVGEDQQVASLMSRMDTVVTAHTIYLDQQLERNGIEQWHGRARFISPHEIEAVNIRGERRTFRGERIVIATGSRPRTPPEIPVDHEHVLDSDSILSLLYLPRTLAVLGAGVIATEYASIFAALGVEVTMIDKGARPVPFMDRELTDRFIGTFAAQPGCRFLGNERVARVSWDGASTVITELESGEVVRTEKMLCALGRVANIEDLNLAAAGLAPTPRGLLEVDEHCRTAVAHVYAVGDVIGPPSLASSAMEQGRRAMRHALGLAGGSASELSPIGIYAIPEMASIGLSEEQARERAGGAIVGRANFAELARGQITCSTDGFLKLVADGAGQKVLGAQILGEGATELVHLAQLAILASFDVDVFVENIFNFPTLAEAYRVAALDVLKRRAVLVTR